MKMAQALSCAKKRKLRLAQKTNQTKHDKITHKWLMYSQMTLYSFMSSFILYLI